MEDRDYLAHLDTAPIFDDALYLAEALDFWDGRHEDDLDATLALAARESGIDDPYRYLRPDLNGPSATPSTTASPSEHRSSMSIHSRDTQSTGLASQQSRSSRDHGIVQSSPAVPTVHAPRPSISSDSCYELPSPRRISIFSRFRRDPHLRQSRSRQSHRSGDIRQRLECGHTLPKTAIRALIHESLESKEQMVPNCCGIPLPRSLLESVLTAEEVDIVSPITTRSPPPSSLRDDSGYSDGGSSFDLGRSVDIPSPTVPYPEVMHRAASSKVDRTMQVALATETFQRLQTQQRAQFERISLFESSQSRALAAHHHKSLQRLESQYKLSVEQATKQHAIALERLDEFQITVEHDLRRSQAQETQNVATALKYMEAYCSGASPGDPDYHTVTDEDRKKLARQQTIQHKLPAKHESAINVLRARQEKDAETKLLKQEAELDQLAKGLETSKRSEEWQYQQGVARLAELIESRRSRARRRWDLKLETWRREWENQHGTTLSGQLPQQDFPELPDNTPLVHSGALGVYYQDPTTS